MKIPLNWLREYVRVPLEPAEYAERMIMSGTGVEGIQKLGEDIQNVVVGRIEKMWKHPNADTLNICLVDVGREERVQIVTGAPNVGEGMLVPVALDGAHLPGGKRITAGALRGEVSKGMLCSGPELQVPEGLYPHCGEEGILIFGEEYAPGTDVRPILGLDDTVIEYEILANRPDCQSVWGIARESAAALGEMMLMPEIEVEETGGRAIGEYVSVSVEDEDLCPRYVARVVDNVRIAPSPMWMRAYLNAAGIRPINNIVDITNYIMLETGHPMHAFDLSKVRQSKIVVRRARDGEEITTLDGKLRKLTRDMLVISDGEGATGLAGVMGGEESEIAEGTRTVMFECAAFDRTNIRLTSRGLGLRTESSGRFEKGVCADTARMAIDRACQLVNMLDGGDVVPGILDLYPNPMKERTITAGVKRISGRVGVDIPGEAMADILDSLLIQTELKGDVLTCQIPAYRQDLESEADLSEEVLRLYGYDKLNSTLAGGQMHPGKRSERSILGQKAKMLLVGQGCYEAMSYSFVSRQSIEKLGLDPTDPRMNPVAILNPLGEDTGVMRTSLVPSMLSTLALNIHRGTEHARLFELAPCFFPGEKGELPTERQMLCIGVYGEGEDFYTLKGVVYALLRAYGILTPLIVAAGDTYFHPGRKAQVCASTYTVAELGEIHPDAASAFEIQRRVYVALIDMDVLMRIQRPMGEVKPLPRYPAVGRDLALVVRDEQPVGPLMDAISQTGGADLEQVSLFDVYRGAQLSAGTKSVAFSLTFRAPDRTLTEGEIHDAMDGILKMLETRFGAKLRE